MVPSAPARHLQEGLGYPRRVAAGLAAAAQPLPSGAVQAGRQAPLVLLGLCRPAADSPLPLCLPGRSGPLELWLTEPTELTLFAPHSSDLGKVRRILVDSGVRLEVHGARTVVLSSPLDISPPPAPHEDDQEDEEEEDGSNVAVRAAATPRLQDMARRLRRRALAVAAEHEQQEQGHGSHLLQLRVDLDPLGSALYSAGPALKPRRISPGTIQLSPRDKERAGGALEVGAGSSPSWPLGSALSEDTLGRYQRVSCGAGRAPAGGLAAAGMEAVKVSTYMACRCWRRRFGPGRPWGRGLTQTTWRSGSWGSR